MKKEDFTIEGSTALKKAFVEDSDIEVVSFFASQSYLSSCRKNHCFIGSEEKRSNHFILSDQYNEALEYVKGFWEEDKLTPELGDVLVKEWNNGDIDIFDVGRIKGGKIYSEKFYCRNGEYLDIIDEMPSMEINYLSDPRFKLRYATSKEIEETQIKTISVSGQFDLKVSKEGIYFVTRNLTSFVDGLCNILLSNKEDSFGGFEYKIKDIIFSFTGRETAETKLSDWQKVWDEYQKSKI